MKNANEERISVYIPKGYGAEEPYLFVSVNGVNYLVPKGKESALPVHVANELLRARRAEQALDKKISRMQEAGA